MEIKNFIKEGIIYYQLYVSCPECMKNGSPCDPSFWVCGECGGDIYVGDNAHMYCSKCEKDFKAIYAHYICPCCSSGVLCNTVEFTSQPNISTSLSMAATLSSVAGLAWLNKFIEELMKQP